MLVRPRMVMGFLGVVVDCKIRMQGGAQMNVAVPTAKVRTRRICARWILMVDRYSEGRDGNHCPLSAASSVQYAALPTKPKRMQKPIQNDADPS